MELLREGQPFWDVLEQHGVETTIVRMPANFPPSGTSTRELSGMGTPDILGTYGTFSFFTSSANVSTDRSLAGGAIYSVPLVDGVVHGTLEGPENPFLDEREHVTAEFTVYQRRPALCKARPRRRGAAAQCWRMERLGAVRLQTGADSEPARRMPILPEAARATFE